MYDLVKSKLPLPFNVAAYFLVLLGIYLLFQNGTIPFGILIIVLSVSSLTIKTGIQFNFADRTFKTYLRIYGHTFGKWENINEIKYISIVPVILKQRYNFLSIGMDTESRECKINFIYPNNKYQSIYTNKYKNILPIAKELANGLNVEILDVSQGKKEWLNQTEIVE